MERIERYKRTVWERHSNPKADGVAYSCSLYSSMRCLMETRNGCRCVHARQSGIVLASGGYRCVDDSGRTCRRVVGRRARAARLGTHVSEPSQPSQHPFDGIRNQTWTRKRRSRNVYKRIFISGCRPRLPLNSFADEHVLVERLGDGVCEGPEVLRVLAVVRDQGIERVVVAAFVLARAGRRPGPRGPGGRARSRFPSRSASALQRVRSACRVHEIEVGRVDLDVEGGLEEGTSNRAPLNVASRLASANCSRSRSAVDPRRRRAWSSPRPGGSSPSSPDRGVRRGRSSRCRKKQVSSRKFS